MNYTIYELLGFFFVYSFLGWCAEVVYAAFRHGKFVNRGFLLGPLCPIYGYGMIAVLYLTWPVIDKPALVFLISALACTVIEFIVGFCAEKLFHQQLWDYSNNPLNLGGYVCLGFSLIWGLGCLAAVYLVHPPVSRLLGHIPQSVGQIVVIALSCCLIADLVITLFHALKIESRMQAIDELEKALRSVSDHIGENLYDGAEAIMEKVQDSEELKEKYRELVERRNIVHEHMFSAFSRLQTGKYRSAYEKIHNARHKSG